MTPPVPPSRIAPVFYDPERKRWPRLRRGVLLAGTGLSTLIGALVVSILLTPALPALSLPAEGPVPTASHLAPPRPPLLLTARQRAARDAERKLELEQLRQATAKKAAKAARAAHPPVHAASTQTIGFYVNWDDASMSSLRKNLDGLDVLIPEWAHLTGTDGAITLDDPVQQQRVIDLVHANRPQLAIMPLVNNWNGTEWEGKKLAAMLSRPEARRRLVDALFAYVNEHRFQGVSIDFESLPADRRKSMNALAAELAAKFRPAGLQVTMNVPADDEAFDYASLAASLDALIVMAYDQHWSTGNPGPIAGVDWFAKALRARSATIPPEKMIVAIGSYGYDWPKKGQAKENTFEEAVLTARESEAEVRFDAASLNPTFDYVESDGQPHAVWFLDAVTAFNQLVAIRDLRPRGVALWRLGSEDPSIWTYLGKPGALDEAAAGRLGEIQYGYDIDYEGKGEVLEITATPESGKREVTFDAKTGLISSERFVRYPSPYVVGRHGDAPKKIALTFDDGPDPDWTPEILDVLKENATPATFFVIGLNAEEHPDLLRREIAEGHEIGNHTFTHPNIASVSLAQLRLELSATNRLLESETSRGTRLFRPPYAVDAEPQTADEVRPLETLRSLGYLTVGMQIDPGDWQRPGVDAIVREAIESAERGDGNIMLLHDSGGDRSQTIDALPTLIRELRQRGFQLVTMSNLLGTTRDQIMPPVSADSAGVFADRLAFGLINTSIRAIHVLFLVGIVLGIGRLVMVGALAALETWWSRHEKFDPAYAPTVAVLVAAYNEEKVIEKTIVSLLACDGPRDFEIVVVDDGSTDSTYERVRTRFADEPRVRVLTQPNGGKSSALNFGLASTHAEVVVALDADTVFARDTIQKLVRHFENPKIGAVAGNAKVGNRVNVMTAWQALEYVTSQNLDRRAFHVLDCITVVPGAVGAWRRSLVEAAGGFTADTLAEDADLTLRLRRLGYSIAYDDEAIALTEAPDTVRGFLRQRYRWMFGTLQAAWKHVGVLFRPRYGSLGFVALPNIFIFQILFPLLSPVMDLLMIFTVVSSAVERWQHPAEASADNLLRVLFYYALFLAIDFLASTLAFALERREDRSLLLWIFPQRFFYRQLMYYVAIKSLLASLRGAAVGWTSVERKATVSG